jgi:hypothetical protein
MVDHKKTLEILNAKLPTIQFTDIKDEEFHAFLTKTHGQYATPFIEWAKHTELKDKITPRTLEKLIAVYDSKDDFSVISYVLGIDPEVKKDMDNFFQQQRKNDQLSKILQVREKINSPTEKTENKKNNL